MTTESTNQYQLASTSWMMSWSENDTLSLWGAPPGYRHRRSAAFCQMAAATIDELKSAGLSGQQLYELAQDCGTDRAKLSELALIFQGYETLLAGTGMDPSEMCIRDRSRATPLARPARATPAYPTPTAWSI